MSLPSQVVAAVAALGLLGLMAVSGAGSASSSTAGQRAASVDISSAQLMAARCGAPANPFRYSFCKPGKLIYRPPSSFCHYFHCIASFWKSTKGYVIQCRDLTFSHSGGRSGSCSSHRGNYRPLYAH
jgi:hypothetical protein